MHWLAVDFGTSNTAVALPHRGSAWRIPIERGNDTLPTAVFFPARGGAMRIGAAASDALLTGDEGRYMRALKSVLGLPLLHEMRLIGGRRQTLADVITAFLAELRARAEAATGLRLTRVLSGRPVHFHTADLARDARAEADLRACYIAAGYTEVAFMAEPEAAALACHLPASTRSSGLGLIVDIGGGTSDFSLFRSTDRRPTILANHGIRLGGTDFDQAVSLDHAMPLLGLGGQLRREMGPGHLPVPRAPYVELATWSRIPFLYTPDARRTAARMERLAVDPAALARYGKVLADELGHTLAFAVEKGKITANRSNAAACIDMAEVAPGLAASVTPDSLDASLARHRAALRAATHDTLALAACNPAQVGEVILVGGSSLMRLVTDEMQDIFPGAAIRTADAFTAIVDGLAIAAGDL